MEMHVVEKPPRGGAFRRARPLLVSVGTSHLSFFGEGGGLRRWEGGGAGGSRVLICCTLSSFSAEQATSSIIPVLSAGRTGAVQAGGGGGGRGEGSREGDGGRQAVRGNDLQFRMSRQAVHIMDFHSLLFFRTPPSPSPLSTLPPSFHRLHCR